MLWQKLCVCIYTCKDAIQCRPWAPPLPYHILSANRLKYIYLFGILRTNDYIWSGFFLVLKKKTPFWAKKQKRTEMRRGSTFYARLL